MATLTVQSISQSGLAPSLSAAASGGDEFVAADDQRYFVEIDNADGSSHTLTIAAQRTTAQQAGVGEVSVSDISVAVAAGTRRFVGPITSAYIRSNDGVVEMTYDAVTSVTVGAFKLPRVSA